MSLKRLLGGVAMAAAPFLAPQVSSFLGLSETLGATAGAALSGAAIGGIGAALGGFSPGLGAAYGGAGGALNAYMSQPTPQPQPSINTGPDIPGTMGPGSPPVAAAPSVPTTAAAPGVPGGDMSMYDRMRRGAQSGAFWQGATQMALAGLSAPNVGMTNAERAAASEAASRAAMNQALFDQRRELVNRELQSTGFSPERAYSQAQMTTQRALRDVNRGRPEEYQAASSRRAAIEGARLGTAAVGEGTERASRMRQGLINQIPTQAPIGAAGVSLPLYEKEQQRSAAFDEAIGRSAGLMFGGLMGSDSYRPAQ